MHNDVSAQSGVQKSTVSDARRAWKRGIWGGKELLGTWGRYLKSQKEDFNPTPEHISRYGVSAVSLLGILTEERFIELKHLWCDHCKGTIADPVDFLQLFRVLLIKLGHFDNQGRYLKGGTPVEATTRLSNLNYYVKELFVAIDVNRDQLVSWDDFVNFVIVDIMSETTSQKSRNFKHASKLNANSYTRVGAIFNQGVEEPVSKMKFYPAWNKVVSLSRKKAFILDCLDLTEASTQTIELDSIITAAEFVSGPGGKSLLTASADLKLRSWNINSLSVQRDMIFPASLRAIRFCKQSGALYVGDRRGYFSVINHEQFMSGKGNPTHYNTRAHSSTITDMVVLPNDIVVTVGLDSKVQSIDPFRNFSLCQYDKKSGHRHGVYSILHVENYRFLVTAGCETHALVWVDSMPLIPSFKLRDPNSPHTSPLAGVTSIPSTPHIVSVDTSGVTKIYDVRTFRMLESFNVLSCEDIQVASIAHTGNRNRQLVYGSKQIHVFEHESKSSDIPRMAHSPDQVLVGCSYLSNGGLVITASSKEVRTWNADSGLPESTYVKLSPSTITCLEVDDRSPSKLLLGHCCGTITVHSTSTGNRLRRYLKHNGAVTQIVMVATYEMFISCSDDAVNFWYDGDSPITRRTGGLPTVKNPIFSTFSDEVTKSQNPYSCVSKLFLPKKTGEVSDATLAAVHKMKDMLKSRKVENSYAKITSSSTTMKLTVNPSRTSKLQNEKTNSGDEMPAARITLENGVKNIVIHPTDPILLVVCKQRAVLYSLKGIGVSCIIHRLYYLAHIPDTELQRGVFLDNSSPMQLQGSVKKMSRRLLVVADLNGVLHLWDVSDDYKRGVCLVKWYNYKTYVPINQTVPPNNDSLDDLTTGCNANMEAAELLQSLASMKPGVGISDKVPIVPTPTDIGFCKPGYLFTSNELGIVMCWDLTIAIKGSQLSNMRQVFSNVLNGKGQSWPGEVLTPTLLCSWDAHKESINGIRVLLSPVDCVITVASDMNIHIWSMTGKHIASLRQGPVFQHHWCFTKPTDQKGKNDLRGKSLWKTLKWGFKRSLIKEINPDDQVVDISSYLKSVLTSQNKSTVTLEAPKNLKPSTSCFLLQSRHRTCKGTDDKNNSIENQNSNVHTKSLSPKHRTKVSQTDGMEKISSNINQLKDTIRVLGSPKREHHRTAAEQKLHEIVQRTAKDRRQEVVTNITTKPAEIINIVGGPSSGGDEIGGGGDSKKSSISIRSKKRKKFKRIRENEKCIPLGCIGDGDSIIRPLVPRGKLQSVDNIRSRSSTPTSVATNSDGLKITSNLMGSDPPLWVASCQFVSPDFSPANRRLLRRRKVSPKIKISMRSILPPTAIHQIPLPDLFPN